MQQAETDILIINAGSSSIKFSLYQNSESLLCKLNGKVDRIGRSVAQLSFNYPPDNRTDSFNLVAASHQSAVNSLLDWLQAEDRLAKVGGIGHRIVHGMSHLEPVLITAELLDELHRIEPYAPDHLPDEIALIETCRARYPQLPQVACFDTAFHRSMPKVASLLAIPRRYLVQGVQRYGFHGLSYSYLLEQLAHLAGREAALGRVILAHLGNGASLAAVSAGNSMDTSMGFTPAAGLPMSTRSGDLDPGVAAYLERTEGMNSQQFYAMVNHQSGLLGLSETSADMRDLLAIEAGDSRAAEAIALFCYQTKKWIGAYAAVLGGLETLVFAGGIGENAAPVRDRICAGLGFLGIELDPSRNAAHAQIISTDASRVTVRVIQTDEALVIAKSVSRILKFDVR